ncbi:unnamed protein product [Chrysoparadoxa australica]
MTAHIKKVRALQEREQRNARQARLRAMLSQQMIKKFGTKKSTSALNAAISEAISKFASSHDKPSNKDLTNLEASLKDLRESFRRQSSCGDKGSHAPAGEQRTSEESSQPRKGEGEGQARSEGPHTSAAGAEVARDWRAFDVARQIEHERLEAEKLLKQQLTKARFRQELDTVRQGKQARKAAEEAEKQRSLEEMNRKREEWLKEQEDEKKLRMERHLEEKKIRDQQIAETKARRDAEKAARLAAERSEIQKANALMEAEAEAANAKKAAERLRLARIRQENEAHLGILEQRKAEETELDMRMMQEYKAMLEKEEKVRADKLKDRMKRYEDIGNFWMERGAGKKQMEEDHQMELAILEEARAKERADIERERRDKEKKKLGQITMAAANRTMMEEKRRLKEEEDRKEQEFLEAFRRETEEYKGEQRAKQIKKHAAMNKYQNELTAQREETARMRKNVEMSETEIAFNADMVRKLQNDPILAQQVKEKLGVAGV